MRAVAIVPVRMAATRLPGKPLLDICGKPMVQRVYERVSQASLVSRVIVATCDREIFEAVRGFGGEAAMTSDSHQSGTDRIAEVASGLEEEVIVNVQGDEPLIDPASIDAAVRPFDLDSSVEMASLMFAIDPEEAKDPNLVKVVVDCKNWAMFFSRSPIPFQRKPQPDSQMWGHVGMYTYTRRFLLEYASMPAGVLERVECLEQLRVLENGRRIKMIPISNRPMGVDTPEDLARVREAFSRTPW